MNRNLRRLIIILIISLTCAWLTDRWYKSVSSFSLDYGDRKPVAEMAEVVNEAQRKPLKRLVWRSLSANEALYAGEMVRTTEESQARIIFPDTGTEISLEPDSMVLIGDDGGHLSLEFLKGFLQVKGGKHDELKLKSGNNAIAVAGSELSLGRNETGAIQLQVFKGDPKIEGNDFQRVKDNFQILKPMPNSMVHVRPDGKDQVQFEWKPLEKEHDLVLEVGKSRKEMAPVAMNQSDASHALALLPPGDYYWRVIGKPKPTEGKTADGETIASSVYRLRVLPKRPPVAIQPAPEKAITSQDPEPRVTLRWANPGQLDGIVIELATSSDLKESAQVIKTEGVEFVEQPLKNGQTYYWRLTGYIPESKEAVSGPVYSFSLKKPAEFAPPKMTSPAPEASILHSEVTASGVNFSWQSASGAQAYQVVINGPNGKPMTVPGSPSPLTQFTLKDLTPGDYEWMVKSFDPNQSALADSPKRKFKVIALARIDWQGEGPEAMSIYGGDKPELFVAWKPGPRETTRYRFSWREEGSEAEPTKQELNTTEFRSNVEKDGRYLATVEALNAKGQIIAKSSERPITVKPSPPLPAPALASQLPDPLKAERNGRIQVTWTSVEGAKSYIVEVRSPKGELIREEKTADPKALLSKLLPGDYTINVRGIDRTGRRGLASTSRPLVVPPVSDVTAPTMKKIKVE